MNLVKQGMSMDEALKRAVQIEEQERKHKAVWPDCCSIEATTLLCTHTNDGCFDRLNLQPLPKPVTPLCLKRRAVISLTLFPAWGAGASMKRHRRTGSGVSQNSQGAAAAETAAAAAAAASAERDSEKDISKATLDAVTM